MPVVIPITTPVDPTVTLLLLLLHVPPAVASERAFVNPWHTGLVPLIGAGEGFTVTMVVITQVVGKV